MSTCIIHVCTNNHPWHGLDKDQDNITLKFGSIAEISCSMAGHMSRRAKGNPFNPNPQASIMILAEPFCVLLLLALNHVHPYGVSLTVHLKLTQLALKNMSEGQRTGVITRHWYIYSWKSYHYTQTLLFNLSWFNEGFKHLWNGQTVSGRQFRSCI